MSSSTAPTIGVAFLAGGAGFGRLRAALGDARDIRVLASAEHIDAARHVLADRTLRIEVVLIAVHLAEGSGFDLLPRGCNDDRAFIVISTDERAQYPVTAFRLGAAGYLVGDLPAVRVLDAVRLVAAGGLAFRATQLDPLRTGPTFTARELRVIQLAGASSTDAEIAAQLAIPPTAVDAYLRDICRRNGFESRAQLAEWVVDQGWLEVR